jgi:hypothetical protein
MPDYRDFSAEVSAIPLVSENILSFSPASSALSASAWANPYKVRVAVFNSGSWTNTFTLLMDKTTLRKYGWYPSNAFDYKILNSGGALRVTGSMTATDSDGIIRLGPVSLGAKELLLYMSVTTDDDHDGMPDDWEVQYGLDPTRNDSGEDFDGDGATNSEEYTNNTDPANSDTDSDGVPDGIEIKWGTNPLNPADKPMFITVPNPGWVNFNIGSSAPVLWQEDSVAHPGVLGCRITDGIRVLTPAQAELAGWIQGTLYCFDNLSQVYLLIPEADEYLYGHRAYWLWSNAGNLKVFIPGVK